MLSFDCLSNCRLTLLDLKVRLLLPILLGSGILSQFLFQSLLLGNQNSGKLIPIGLWFKVYMRTAVLDISVVLLCILVSFLKELGLLFLLNYGIFFHKFLSKLIFFRF